MEIKKAAGGPPTSLPQTISAFANGSGGLIILGVDEAGGFTPVPVKVKTLADALAQACADRVVPAVRAHIEVVTVDGMPVVAARIPATESSLLPVYVKHQGIETGSYIRAHDGDRRLSSYEIHVLVAGRGQPRDDIAPVQGVTTDDLDSDEVGRLVARLRRTRGRAFERASHTEVLRLAGVIPRGGEDTEVTLAGLLTLGVYPQAVFPQLNVTFVSYPTVTGRRMADGTRFLENAAIDGTIPQMASGLVAALMRAMSRRSVMVGIGRADAWEYPVDAVRELIVNALMHRDYHPLSHGAQVRVEMFPDRLVFINPGGLYGTTPRQLAAGKAFSSRNAILARLLEDVEMPGTGHMVCENRGSGIRLVTDELAAAGQRPPEFDTDVATFTVILRPATPGTRPEITSNTAQRAAGDTDANLVILAALATGPKSNQDLQAATGLGRTSVSRRLLALEERGIVEPTENRKSRNLRWRRTDTSPQTTE